MGPALGLLPIPVMFIVEGRGLAIYAVSSGVILVTALAAALTLLIRTAFSGLGCSCILAEIFICGALCKFSLLLSKKALRGCSMACLFMIWLMSSWWELRFVVITVCIVSLFIEIKITV